MDNITSIKDTTSDQIIPFSVLIPKSSIERDDDIDKTFSQKCNLNTAAPVERCVVGTVTCMHESAMIWFGWGFTKTDAGDGTSTKTPTSSAAEFGGLTVAMPQSYNDGAQACSQLLEYEAPNSDADDAYMIGLQMAARLSKKLGWPIFVSCALDARGLGQGVKFGLTQRASALAEKEVGRILLAVKQRN